MAIKLSLKPHLAIPKAQVEMGPHYFVKQIALNSVTEQVGYGCLTNLLLSSLSAHNLKRALLSSDDARIIK